MTKAVVALAAALLGVSAPAQAAPLQTHYLAWPGKAGAAPRPRLALHEQLPASGALGRPVLYIHGATIPAKLTVFYRFQGKSWADALNSAGFDVFGLDFAGFGDSGRFASMAGATPGDGRPDGDSDSAVEEIEIAVRFILARTKAKRVSIVSHSWGTIAAGRFAALHPEMIDRLVLFGAVGRRNLKFEPVNTTWEAVTVEDQRGKFLREVPAGHAPKLFHDEFARWGEAYLATDPESARRDPPSVVVPLGPAADGARAASGRFPYDMSRILAPTLIVRGKWDGVGSSADANWLRGQLTRAAGVESVELPEGTHLMHLETGRDSLFATVNAFLSKQTKMRR